MSDDAAIHLPLPASFVQGVARLAAKLVLEQLHDRPAAAPPWMDTREAAEYTRIPYETFRKLAAARQVPMHKRGSRNLFYRDELDHWLLNDGQAPARAPRRAAA